MQDPKQYLTTETKNFFINYFAQVKQVLLKPQIFFAEMKTDGNFKDPLIFSVISVGIAAIMSFIMSFNIGIAFVIFVCGVLGTGVVSLVAYYLCKVMKGTGSLEATYRVFAYSSAIQLISWIPVINFVGGIYLLTLNYMGLKRIHNLSNGAAIAVILISGILSVVVFCTVAVTIFLKQLFHF